MLVCGAVRPLLTVFCFLNCESFDIQAGCFDVLEQFSFFLNKFHISVKHLTANDCFPKIVSHLFCSDDVAYLQFFSFILVMTGFNFCYVSRAIFGKEHEYDNYFIIQGLKVTVILICKTFSWHINLSALL